MTWSNARRSQRPAVRPARGRQILAWALTVLVLVAIAFAIWYFVLNRPTQHPSVATPVASPSPTAAVPSPAPQTEDPREHRWLGRPLARSVPRDFADRTYLYGASKNNAYRVHHGLDFWNPTGTPVQAAADGTVVFAGKDAGTRFGPQTIPGFYGNMVLVKLARQYKGRDLYFLAGHLDSTSVQQGQQIKAGDVLGKVGMTGTADGPHLHLEVRVGGTTYADSRNPALWLRYLPGSGGLVGKITNRAGKPAANVPVTLVKDITSSDIQKYWGETPTYPPDPLGQINPDEDWGENFAFGDLPVGYYEVRVTIGTQTYLRRVTIRDGRTAWLELQDGSAIE